MSLSEQSDRLEQWLKEKSQKSLLRLLPELEERFSSEVSEANWLGYTIRLKKHFPRLFGLLHTLYGKEYDFFYHLRELLALITRSWIERSPDLKALDASREVDPHWFQSNRMLGAMCYVDLFEKNLAGLQEKIPYLKELGITYIHLMPIFKTLDGDNDGGYAVSSYRELDPKIGSMGELVDLSAELRNHGISLSLDFVFNHTSDEHEWARRARAGEKDFQEYYRMYDDRTLPDQFEANIQTVFPDEHQGAFTYRSKIKKWVWTTFHNYQWDLNYENPLVFNNMVSEMLFLANIGVQILRMDAVAFIWKRVGTSCENLPEAHLIIQAFNAAAQIAAPAMVFKSEAIVHPDEVNKYIDENECQLSYNPELMALLWNSLATADVRLLRNSLEKRFPISVGTAWVNYIRCHDDIGWTFSDEEISALGWNPAEHRKFLTRFFTGKEKGSFAKGLPFQMNDQTGDARVSGTLASLVGIESTLESGADTGSKKRKKEKSDKDAQKEQTETQDSAETITAEHLPDEQELAIRRILLLYGVILTIGGIPLIYLGDEIAMLNDYSFAKVPDKEGDSRWVHRMPFDWQRAEERNHKDQIAGRVYHGLQQLIQIRKQNLAFSRSETEFIQTGKDSVFGYFRHHEEQSALVLANFSAEEQSLNGKHLRQLGMRKIFTDIVSGQTMIATQALTMKPYQLLIFIGVT